MTEPSSQARYDIEPPVLDAETLDPTEEPALSRAPVEQRRHPDAVAIKSGRLAGLTMNRAIWVMAWPVLCESLLNSTIGLVDTFLSSSISQAATDAVAGALYMFWFMGLMTMAIGVGATALVSRAMGAGKRAVARAALGQAMLLAILAGVVIAAAMAALAGPLAGVMSMRGEAADDLRRYVWAYCCGVPFSTVLFTGTACARGAGDTLRPLWTMVVVNVVNFAVAWTLAHGLGWGVTGIGLGTAAAHAVGAVVILRFHFRGASGIDLLGRWMRPHTVTMWRLLRLGLPNLLETLGMWVVNFSLMLMVGRMGARALENAASTAVGDSGGLLGAHLWAGRIEAYSYMPGFAMGIAASALCGQYIGAGLPQMARRAAVRCAAIAAAIMGCCGLVFIAAGGWIVASLTSQPAHLELTPRLLAITGYVQVPFALAIVFRSAMHGAGDVRAVMVMTWISQWGLRLPLAYALCGVDIPLPGFVGGGVLVNPFGFNLGLPGLWIGLCLELVLRALIYGTRFMRGAWVRARV